MELQIGIRPRSVYRQESEEVVVGWQESLPIKGGVEVEIESCQT